MIKVAAPSFDDAEIALVRECLASGWVTQGPLTERFEQLVARRHRVAHAIATTSCTAALHLAMMALGIGPGDEVIVPAFTWVTTAHAAEYVGARPVFVDVSSDTFNIDPARIEAAITPRTRAVVAVHLFGLAAPMAPILEMARRRGIAVVEDAACAIGTTYRGKPVGAFGDIGCFSFHPRKVVTTGEGGLVTTDRDDLAASIRSLRNHGSTGLPSEAIEERGPWTMATFDRLGFNLRFSDIQAAVGIAQMAKLDRLLAERRARAQRYSRLLADVQELALPDRGGIGNEDGSDIAGHTYQSYVVRLVGGDRSRRNDAMRHLARHDIETRPGTHAVHRLGFYANKYGYRPEDFPQAAVCEDATITLPILPGMTDADQDTVIGALTDALRS